LGIGPSGGKKQRRQTAGLTRGRKVSFETLTAKGAEKLARVFTTAVAKWKGDKWYASPEEIEEFGESFSDMLEPFPALSQFVATYSAPLIFAGTMLGYVWLRKNGVFQPNQTLQVPVAPQRPPQTVTPPPPIRPATVAAQPPQPPQESTNGQRPVYSSVVDAAPLMSAMDN
jgi:hypothetical protein